MKDLKICDEFDKALTGRPYVEYPNVFGDHRGTFSEVMAEEGGLAKIKQINRSTSCPLAFRGFHAQKKPFCQSKLVEAITVPIIDIIIDARPDSMSFGLCEAFLLDPKPQNKLYVPRGFLHGFFVPAWDERDFTAKEAVFMYYCDNIYDHSSEICVAPKSVLNRFKKTGHSLSHDDLVFDVMNMLDAEPNIVLSEKDSNGEDYDTFMQRIKKSYDGSGELWY